MVTAHEMPFRGMNKKVGTKVENTIALVEVVEVDDDGVGVGKATTGSGLYGSHPTYCTREDNHHSG